MWNRPQLMSAISDLLFLAGAAALLVAGAVWAARLPLFPLQEVVITQELSELRRDELEYTLAGHLKGNFFSVNLDALRASLEQLPWVRRADARRRACARRALKFHYFFNSCLRLSDVRWRPIWLAKTGLTMICRTMPGCSRTSSPTSPSPRIPAARCR